MKRFIVYFILLFPFLLSGQTVVRWHTTMGNFTAELREDVVPITAYNFINLTKDNFYDGLRFHRVVSGFVIQDGDPTGTGYGGSDTTIPLEIHPEMVHNTAGTLGMARSSDPNSASSQYYITLAPTPNLNGNYAVYGYVFEGLDIVQAIGEVETNSNDAPIEPVYIDSIRILTPDVTTFEPVERDIVIDQHETLLFALYCDDFPVTYQWSVNEEPIENNMFFWQYVFSEAGNYQISGKVAGDFEYEYVKTWNITVNEVSSQSEHEIQAQTYIANSPNPFNPETIISYEIKESINNAEIQIFNTKGQLIRQFPIQSQQGSIVWNGKNSQEQAVGSGIYLYILRVNGKMQSINKCLLLK
jgi:cyclophilin family peptidyl-prolyl cis-trans isomerase